MKGLIWGRIAQIILAFVGVFNLYQALFALWMTAYPFADPNVWRTRLYIRAAATILVALVLIPLTIWLRRQSRRLKI
jgi:hypothetical protein